jgi:anti-anti-sigma factor
LSVDVEGALDFFTAADVRNRLLDVLEHEPGGLVVDVQDAFVDSSGIGVLLQVAQRARQECREFHLVCEQGLAHVLRVHGLTEILGIEEVRAKQTGDGRREERTRQAA